MKFVHLIMVHSYNRISEIPVRILSNVIQIVSGGHQYSDFNPYDSIYISKYI